LDVAHTGTQISDQGPILPEAAVHFPITDDQFSPHVNPSFEPFQIPGNQCLPRKLQTCKLYRLRRIRVNAALGMLMCSLCADPMKPNGFLPWLVARNPAAEVLIWRIVATFACAVPGTFRDCLSLLRT
jgi:hypothetical protein